MATYALEKKSRNESFSLFYQTFSRQLYVIAPYRHLILTILDMIECVIKTFPFPMKSEWGWKENNYVVSNPKSQKKMAMHLKKKRGKMKVVSLFYQTFPDSFMLLLPVRKVP